jgi:DNA-binding LacI/PurR family transcriptional regulator
MSMIEIAQRVGVSQATVSRYFNGSRVNAEKAKAISMAAKSIGYIYAARNKSEHETLSLEVLSKTALVFWGQGRVISSRPGISQIIQGIESSLSRFNASLMIAEVNSAQALAEKIKYGGYTSLILSGSLPDDGIKEIVKTIPTVWVLSRLPQSEMRIDQILPDDVAIGQIASNYLLKQCKRKKFAFINSERNHYSFNMRCKGFVDSLSEAGVECDIFNGSIVGPNPSESQLISDMRVLIDELLSLDSLPEGIFLPADDQTSVFYAELNQRNFNIAENFKVISCNHLMPFLFGLRPRPASVETSLHQIGELAVHHLLWRSFMGSDMPSVVTLVEPKLCDE